MLTTKDPKNIAVRKISVNLSVVLKGEKMLTSDKKSYDQTYSLFFNLCLKQGFKIFCWNLFTNQNR